MCIARNPPPRKWNVPEMGADVPPSTGVATIWCVTSYTITIVSHCDKWAVAERSLIVSMLKLTSRLNKQGKVGAKEPSKQFSSISNLGGVTPNLPRMEQGRPPNRKGSQETLETVSSVKWQLVA